MAGLEIKNLNKAFGPVSVLNNVSLDIADGEFLTLLGPSGCGKSTLLRIIAGLEIQDSGQVEINGQSVDHLRPKKRDVAMVFQSYALYPHMTVGQNIAVPLRMRQLTTLERLPLIGRLLPSTQAKNAEIEREVTRVAKSIDIGHLLARKPAQLSGGQRQRVAVGRAMVRRPSVFLMDEPLSNLDAKLRVQMRAEIKELHRRLGITFIYVTHDQAEAMTLSDRVAVMLNGNLLQVAPPAAIYSDPIDQRVAEFIGSPKINILDGVAREGGLFDVAGSTFALGRTLHVGNLLLGIRPEAFHLAERAGPGALTGHVRMVEHLGSDLYVHLDMPGQNTPIIARLLAERAPQIRHGETLHLAVKSEQMIIFDRDGNRIATTGNITHLRNLA
jgi:multiple sugar transport system ATP-binding protein